MNFEQLQDILKIFLGNNFMNLNDNSIENLPSLITLEISHKLYEKTTKEAFRNLPNLKEIKLADPADSRGYIDHSECGN